MTDEQIVKLLARRISLEQLTLVATAADIGVSVQYLHDVLNLNRRPGPKILAWLGFERKTEIVKLRALVQ